MFGLFSKAGIATVLFALLLIVGIYLTAEKESWSNLNPPERSAGRSVG